MAIDGKTRRQIRGPYAARTVQKEDSRTAQHPIRGPYNHGAKTEGDDNVLDQQKLAEGVEGGSVSSTDGLSEGSSDGPGETGGTLQSDEEPGGGSDATSGSAGSSGDESGGGEPDGLSREYREFDRHSKMDKFVADNEVPLPDDWEDKTLKDKVNWLDENA